MESSSLNFLSMMIYNKKSTFNNTCCASHKTVKLYFVFREFASSMLIQQYTSSLKKSVFITFQQHLYIWSSQCYCWCVFCVVVVDHLVCVTSCFIFPCFYTMISSYNLKFREKHNNIKTVWMWQAHWHSIHSLTTQSLSHTHNTTLT